MTAAFGSRQQPPSNVSLTGGAGTGNYYVVGDSQATPVLSRNGNHGSAQSGHGYTVGLLPDALITFHVPTQPHVLMFVSIWDTLAGSPGLDRYSTAHDFYSSFDVTVTWIGCTPTPGFDDGVTQAECDTHNDAVATEIGATVGHRTLRDVELQGDGQHPTSHGADILHARCVQLTTDLAYTRGNVA